MARERSRARASTIDENLYVRSLPGGGPSPTRRAFTAPSARWRSLIGVNLRHEQAVRHALPRSRDELAPPHRHSITSSARATSVDGISRPSVFAVLRLITS